MCEGDGWKAEHGRKRMSLNTWVDHPQQQKRRVQAREGDEGDLQQKDSSEIEREDLQEGSEACYDASLGSSGIKKSVRAEGAEIFSGS